MTSLRGKYEVEVKFENSIHNYNATLVHWHHTLGCQCSSFDSYAVHKVVPFRALIAKKLNYFTTSLRGKNKVEVKFENSMHNYNATLVHWHHTLGCQYNNLCTYDVHKVVPVRVLIAEKLNYFITLLRGKYEVEVKFENSMHKYNATLVHWHHTLGCQCSSFILTLFTKWYLSEHWTLKNWTILRPSYEVKMRLRLNLKTACTTTMPP